MITEPQTNGFRMADIPRNQGFRVCVMQIQGREVGKRKLGCWDCQNVKIIIHTS